MYSLIERKRELFADKLLKEGYWVKYDLLAGNILVKRNNDIWEVTIGEAIQLLEQGEDL